MPFAVAVTIAIAWAIAGAIAVCVAVPVSVSVSVQVFQYADCNFLTFYIVFYYGAAKFFDCFLDAVGQFFGFVYFVDTDRRAFV
ncbi:MAG: hypothetical protein BWY75_03149 [bacterium ADurb.Bin425]|nr:MAG: hypothetical protein BWY75_03149 [bacterium ADurb.Bin425]